MNPTGSRVSFVFLCAVPVLTSGLTAVRALRISGVYQTVGAVHFAAVCLAAWMLGLRVIRGGTEERRRLALAAGLLLAPFALVSLLWVGLGPPWVANATENRMRYLVLLTGAIAVAGAFIVLKDVLSEAGERFYSVIGFSANIFAGAAYMIWLTFYVAVYVVKVRDGQVPPAIVPLINMSDILLFVACVLTYLTAGAFAVSLGRAGWLPRGAARAYVVANLVALLLIVVRGLSFPDPAASSTPWYTQPGLVVGIPAVPWIIPFLLGVVLLRRAGDSALWQKATEQTARAMPPPS
jgi:hypothetical protein